MSFPCLHACLQRFPASSECLPSWKKGTGLEGLLTLGLAHSSTPPITHAMHTFPSSMYGLKPTKWNSVPCLSWPGLPRLQDRGFGEGKQSQMPLKQGSRCKNPFEVMAAILLFPDNSLPFAINRSVFKCLPVEEKFNTPHPDS